MIIAKNDEAKRSKIWRIVTLVSSLVIVLIAVYLLTKLFTTNPLEGTWADEDGNYIIAVKSNNSISVTIPDFAENGKITIKMDYAINKEEKTVTMKQNEAELKKASDKSDGVITVEALENALSPITTTFDYSIDKKKLTLTEREYGEQMTFTKK